MVPGPYDLPTIWRGCNWPAIILIWKDKDGNPYDLTDWIPFAQTRSGINLNPVVTEATNGVTVLSMTQEQSAGLKLGTVEWDWIWENSGLKYPPFLAGTVEVKQPRTSNFTPPPPPPPPPQ